MELKLLLVKANGKINEMENLVSYEVEEPVAPVAEEITEETPVVEEALEATEETAKEEN